MDRFGSDAKLVPDGDTFLLTADVVMGPEFWGWMTTHADRAAVIAPPWAAKQWQERFKPRLPERVKQPKAV